MNILDYAAKDADKKLETAEAVARAPYGRDSTWRGCRPSIDALGPEQTRSKQI